MSEAPSYNPSDTNQEVSPASLQTGQPGEGNSSNLESQGVDSQPEDTDQVDESQEEGGEETPDLEDVEVESRPNNSIFSWRDVALVHQFAVEYGKADGTRREFAQEIIGLYGDPIDIAQGLYPPGGVISSIDFIAGLVSGGDNLTPTQAMRRGIQLASDIGAMDVEDIRLVARRINVVLSSYSQDSEGITEIRYRRNMSTDNTLDLFMSATENISNDGVEAIKWVQSLLSIWPSGSR